MLLLKRVVPLLATLFLFIGESIARTIKVTPSSRFNEEKATVVNELHLKISIATSSITEIKGGSKTLFIVLQASSNVTEFAVSGSSTPFQPHTKSKTSSTGILMEGNSHIIAITRDSHLWHDVHSSKTVYVTFFSHHSTIMYSATFAELLPLNMGKRYIADVAGVDLIRFTTKVTPKQGNHQFKFVVSEIDNHVSTSVTGYGLKGDQAATPQTAVFNFSKYGHAHIGAVFDQWHPLYCTQTECSYSVTVEPHGAHRLSIYLGDHANIEMMAGPESTIGDITKESIKFNIFSYTIHKIGNMVITLIPVFGNPKLQVHPGFLPKDDSQWFYGSSGLTAQRIIITEQNLKDMGLAHSGAQIMSKVDCQQPCRYLLKTAITHEGIYDIDPGHTETGSLNKGELRQFLIKTRHNSDMAVEKMYVIKLSMISGSADLHANICQKFEECKIEKADLNSTSVLHNRDSKPVKDIRVHLFCGKKPANLPAGAYYSQRCGVVVGIEASKNQTGAAKYDLTIEDDLDIHELKLGVTTSVKLFPGITKSYSIDYKETAQNSSGFEFILDGKYGNFHACVKVNKQSNCIQELSIDANGVGLANSYRRMHFTQTGSYIMELKANDAPASLVVSLQQKITSADHSVFRGLRPGATITDHIEGDSSKGYSFQLYSQIHTRKVKAVQLRLRSLRGSFVMVVRNDGQNPTLENNQWKSFSGDITITKDDPFFKDDAVYQVRVYPVFDKESSGEFMYQLSLSFTDVTSQLEPGMIEVSTMVQPKQCFVAEFLQTYNSVLIMKGGSQGLDLFVSMGEIHKAVTAKNHDFEALSESSGIYMTKDDIHKYCEASFAANRHCTVYLCIHGAKQSRYSLGFTANDKPFILPHSQVVHGPIPTADQDIKFIYHPQRDTSVDIEEFSTSGALEISGGVIEASEIKGDWPDNQMKSMTVVSTTIHIDREKLLQFKHPVMFIKLFKSRAIPAKAEKFNLQMAFNLEAGRELKELVKDSSREGRQIAGEWRYFYFYNHDLTSPLYVSLDSLNNADCDLFITRGKDTRPTVSNFIQRSYDYRSVYLQLNLEKVRARGFKDMAGYYVVGVKANGDIHYTLRWGSNNATHSYVRVNSPRTLTIPENSTAYVEMYNFWMADMEVIVDSHHHNMMLYWTVKESNVKYMENDLELFPGIDNYKLQFEISNLKSIHMFKISKDIPGFCTNCRFLFSIQNFEMEPVQIDFKVSSKMNNSNTEMMYLGNSIFAAGDKNEEKNYIFSASLTAMDADKYYIEVQFMNGAGVALLSHLNSFSQSGAPVFTQPLKVGFNRISLASLATNISTPSTPGWWGYQRAKFTIKLDLDSSFRAVLMKKGNLSPLVVNQPREGYIDMKDTAESYIYQATGNEQMFDVRFVIDELTNDKIPNLSESELRSLMKVHYLKKREDLVPPFGDLMQANETYCDPINGRLGASFKPMQGFYVVVLNSNERTGYRYRLVASTSVVNMILPGRQSIGYTASNKYNQIYEFYPHQPGSIFVKLNRCFGNMKLSVHEGSLDGQYQEIPIDYHRFQKIWQVEKANQPFYMKVEPTYHGSQNREFGYLNHSVNSTAFNLEVFEAEAWQRIPFDEIKPYDDDIFVDLNSSPPQVHFRPLILPSDNKLEISTRYFVIISKDPDALHYYANCDGAEMNRFLKAGYTIKDAIQVFPAPENIVQETESTSMKPYLTLPIPVASGHRYFMVIYAQLNIKTPRDMPHMYTTNRLRIVYETIEFEYRSFFYPVELLAATFGLLGLVIATCCVMNTRFLKTAKKAMGGFKNIEQSDVDQDLEEYFMRIKLDYQREEERSRNETTVDMSNILSESIVGVPPKKKIEEEAEETTAPQETILEENPQAEDEGQEEESEQKSKKKNKKKKRKGSKQDDKEVELV